MTWLSRRNVLQRAGLLGGLSVAAKSAAIEPAPSAANASRRLKVIVCGGHPGDPEYGCGGIVVRYAERGHDVVLLYLNDGNPTPERGASPGAARTAEARKACEILGARPLFAGQVDGRAVVDEAHYIAFRRLIAAERPDVLFTHWPIDNHADHRAMTMLAYDAWQSQGKSAALYYYEVSNGEDTVQFAPDCYVDITPTEPKKRLACFAHASQAPDKFYALQEHVTRMRGIERGYRHAEGFIRHIQSPNHGLPVT